VAGKRHHYLPGLLLRRFAEASGKREGLLWRLDKVSGQPRPVAPKYEAALPHYYRLEHPDGTTDSRPEDLLASIENATGPILQRLERGEKPTDADRAWLALFVVLQHRRTPIARGWLNFLDEFASTLMTEVSLANKESFHRRARSAEPNMTFEEVEEMRLELLADLQSGRATIGSTPSREVAAMFVAADKVRRSPCGGVRLGGNPRPRSQGIRPARYGDHHVRPHAADAGEWTRLRFFRRTPRPCCL
jgi:hypothetical protein